jgi:large subunit ribosomal protein L23
MRDYLYRLYGVKVLSIRSYVRQFKARRSGPGGPWKRPQSKKKMTVEMHEPFVWPEPPEDMTP